MALSRDIPAESGGRGMSKPPIKLFVLGLDGACFDLIQPWLDQGKLPTFQALVAEGASGPMESCIPPITCPAWKCYSTGKYPGKLGVFWWEQLDLPGRRVILPNATSFRSAEVWDYLNEADLRTGVVGMPMTYPPRPIRGFMVAGGPDCPATGYTYPEQLEDELKTALGYRTQGEISATERAVADALDLIEMQLQAAEYLADHYPVDFLHLTSFQINGPLQHFLYDDQPVLEAWQRVDRWLARFAERCEHILVMSDHGTSPLRKNFYLNAWLKQAGYLLIRRTISDWALTLGLTRRRLRGLVRLPILRRLLKRIGAVQRLAQRIPSESGLFGDHEGQVLIDSVDWGRTRAVALPQGLIYINREIFPNDVTYQNFRAQLRDELREIRDPETGQRVFQEIFLAEELYGACDVPGMPDLVALDADEYHNRGGIKKEVIFEESEWRGNNAYHGLCIWHGPQIACGRKLSGIRIVDLAPTILHLLGLPVPEDMDGQVQREVFDEGSEAARRDIRSDRSISVKHETLDADEEIVRERLRALGYLE